MVCVLPVILMNTKHSKYNSWKKHRLDWQKDSGDNNGTPRCNQPTSPPSGARIQGPFQPQGRACRLRFREF